ncbi:MAG: hypothetical protein DWQ08_08075 [Proteobacteria bacterium]|nr:MAG: hypothetical protein DWQ08_08075 [Pseudomonadota bacterium]
MAKETIIVSHWSTMIQGLQVSPQEFFNAIEDAIKEKELPNAKHSRIDWKEGGIMSAKREYLRIRRADHAFDICGAPFGNGFFVSWWLGQVPAAWLAFLMRIPVIGILAERFFKPQTYYRIDTRLMFQSLVHGAVMQVIDEMTKAKGLRALGDVERKPEMRDFFAT